MMAAYLIAMLAELTPFPKSQLTMNKLGSSHILGSYLEPHSDAF